MSGRQRECFWSKRKNLEKPSPAIPISSLCLFCWRVARDCLIKSMKLKIYRFQQGDHTTLIQLSHEKKLLLLSIIISGCLKLDSHCWALQIPICPLQNPKNPQGFFAALSWAGDWSQANILHLSETVHRFIFRDWLIIANKTGPHSDINGVISSVSRLLIRPVIGYKVGPYQLYQL